MAWPMAKDFHLTLDKKLSTLEMPLRKIDTKDATSNKLTHHHASSLSIKQIPHEVIEAPNATRYVKYDIVHGDIHYHVANDTGDIYFKDNKSRYFESASQDYYINDNHPLSAKIIYNATFSLKQKKWDVQVYSKLEVTCDEGFFLLKRHY